ncbi:MAG: hypothetical protein H0Z33_10230 [Bacillaceae bacterium]|nr:hypothetical protein [Bacillaceae bacterium]
MKSKQLVFLSIAFAMIFSSLIAQQEIGVAGTKEQPSAPTEGTPSKNLKNWEGGVSDISIQSTQYLMSASSFIDRLSSTKVRVGRDTKAYTYVDSITINLYLQRWDSSEEQWKDVVTVGSLTNYNSSIVSLSKQVSVPSGKGAFFIKVQA